MFPLPGAPKSFTSTLLVMSLDVSVGRGRGRSTSSADTDITLTIPLPVEAAELNKSNYQVIESAILNGGQAKGNRLLAAVTDKSRVLY